MESIKNYGRTMRKPNLVVVWLYAFFSFPPTESVCFIKPKSLLWHNLCFKNAFIENMRGKAFRAVAQ